MSDYIVLTDRENDNNRTALRKTVVIRVIEAVNQCDVSWLNNPTAKSGVLKAGESFDQVIEMLEDKNR